MHFQIDDSVMTTDGNKDGGRYSAGHRAMGAGLTMAVTVGLFAFGGIWIDRKLGTRPWFLLLMVFLGIAGGMLHLIRVVAPDMWPFDKPARTDRARGGSDGGRPDDDLPNDRHDTPPPPG